MSSACKRRCFWRRTFPLAGLACLVLSGCFSGEYGSRMEQTISKLTSQEEKAGAVFDTATDIVDGISLRLPVFVDDKASYLGAGSPNAQPPFFALPGFAHSYEIPVDGGPAYVYLAAVKSEGKPADTVAQEVQAAVEKTFSGAAWQDVSLENLSGNALSAKRLSVVGKQVFGAEKLDGQFDLYLVSSADYSVLIGWRASSIAAGALGFFEKATISVGTVGGTR